MTTAIKVFATKQIQPAITLDSLKDSGGRSGLRCPIMHQVKPCEVFKGFQRVNPNYVTRPPDFISSDYEYECEYEEGNLLLCPQNQL